MCPSKRNRPTGRGSTNRQQYRVIPPRGATQEPMIAGAPAILQPRSAIQAERASLPPAAQKVLNALDAEVAGLVQESQRMRRELATMQRRAHNAGLRPSVPEFLPPVPYHAN